MSALKRAIPSPALAVAVIALIAAFGGSAIAEQATTAGSGLSKKQRNQVTKLAKKQANKRIDKKAPGLSVARADSAGDAEALDGATADELRTRSAFAERTTVQNLGSPAETVGTTITTAGTRIVATATAEVTAVGEAAVTCFLEIAGTSGEMWDMAIPGTASANEVTFSFTFAHEVAAGTHAIKLFCATGGGSPSLNKAVISAVA